MSKKFLSLIILGLCSQGVDSADATSCQKLITACESKWEDGKWKKNPSTLSKGIENVCKAIITKDQMKKWPGIFKYCTDNARTTYNLHQVPAKIAPCEVMVGEINENVQDNPKYKGKGEYCKK